MTLSIRACWTVSRGDWSPGDAQTWGKPQREEEGQERADEGRMVRNKVQEGVVMWKQGGFPPPSLSFENF